MRSNLRKGSVRRAGRIFAAALAVCTAAALCAPALAADAADTEKTYTVRVYSGQRGLIDGKTVWEKEYKAGDQVIFSAQRSVSLEDNKYYVKGIRESGKDYKEDNPSFFVERDIDYVVSYGILGSSVAYTVNYLDRAGNILLPSETYYGNVGDQPVIAYQYIEGWLPQAYNLTRTLSDNAAENVFDFIYTSTTAGGAEEPGAEGTEGAGGEAAGEGAGAGTAAGAGAAGAGGAAGADGGLVAAPDEGTPQDLINLDEEETPLANLGEGLKSLFDPDGNGTILKVPRTLILGAAVLIALPFIFLLLRRKKAKKEQG